MTRHSFIWSLLAMVLALLGLRLPKGLSLSAHGMESYSLDFRTATYPEWSARVKREGPPFTEEELLELR